MTSIQGIHSCLKRKSLKFEGNFTKFIKSRNELSVEKNENEENGSQNFSNNKTVVFGKNKNTDESVENFDTSFLLII